MDLDGDGDRDMLTGSYYKTLYVFRGDGKGGFEVAEPLLHGDGTPIEPGNAATVFAADWDSDGDLDLITGNSSGVVALVPNTGSATAPVFGESRALNAGGRPIRVNGGDAGPCVADWDGDGLLDLVVGTGSGGVVWYRNEGTATKPKLDGARTLTVQGDRGSRAKVAVADWNHDGQLDLLVGDFAYDKSKAVRRTAAEQKTLRDARKRHSELRSEWKTLIAQPLGRDAKAREERAVKLRKLQKEMDAEKAATEQLVKSSSAAYRGNVWVFLRKSIGQGPRPGR